MILVIILTAMIVAMLLSTDGIDVSFDWQAMLPMMDDMLTLIGLLLAIVTYILVIAFRYNRILSTSGPKVHNKEFGHKIARKRTNSPVLHLAPLVINTLNQ